MHAYSHNELMAALWDVAERRSVLINGIHRIQPDLVGFAESVKTEDYDQTTDLPGPEFVVAHSKTRDPNGMGISIGSRGPLTEVHELDLNVTPRTAGFPTATWRWRSTYLPQ